MSEYVETSSLISLFSFDPRRRWTVRTNGLILLLLSPDIKRTESPNFSPAMLSLMAQESSLRSLASNATFSCYRLITLDPWLRRPNHQKEIISRCPNTPFYLISLIHLHQLFCPSDHFIDGPRRFVHLESKNIPNLVTCSQY